MDKEILEILKRLETKMATGLDRLETKINVLETKLDEHTLILRALEHSAEVIKLSMIKCQMI